MKAVIDIWLKSS